MESNRLKLQSKLEELLGTRNVYFNPPENFKMKYPCIVYNRQNIDRKYADNKSYKRSFCYKLTFINSDPDDVAIEKILELPMSRFDRQFPSDGLIHTIFTIYF